MRGDDVVARSEATGFDPRYLAVGLVAGIGYGMMEMVIEAVIGKGLWSPLRYIASVFTLGKDTDPSFALIPVVVGLMGHMMNSVIFGVVFSLWISRLASGLLGLAVLGMVYAAAIFIAMWYAVLPVIDPAMLLVNGPGFFASHLIYGLLLGVGVSLVRERRAAAPAL
jgi:hypothetical protein